MASSKLYIANGLCLFGTFLFGRLFYQIYITFWIGAPWVSKQLEAKSLTFYEGIVVLEMMIMVIGSLVLNLWWFYLMIQMVMRLVKRMQ